MEPSITLQHPQTMPTSKFFRVATEGATTDGRVIDRATITQLAQSFNPKTYGARIWMEHIRGMTADSIFKAYGDVVAVKADEVETDTGKKLALFAQISPTPDLIAMSKARQKIYTSLEINPKFSDTGLPYLVGLGITDSPASLGTDILTFSAQQGENSPFAARKQNPDNFYTEAVEITVEFDDKPTDPDTGKLTTTLKNLFKKITTSDAAQDARFAELSTAIETVAQHVVTELDSYASQLTQIATLEKTITDLHNNFTAFKQLMDTQDSNPDQRPPAIGGPGTILTDC